jgi:purine nucleoside permease
MQERKNRTGLVTKTQELVLLALASFTLSCSQDNSAQDTIAGESRPIEVKIVLVTMFEIGADTGDTAGEFQLWKERRSLDQVFPFHAHHDLHFNAEDSILVIVTGAGTAKAAASIMALGMDSRFDLSNSYWLVAGIAGFDPADASVGSAAWDDNLV